MDFGGGDGQWGAPDYLTNGSWFRNAFPEVEIWIERTDAAAKRWATEGAAPIDLLIIDADHSWAGSLRDALDWIPFLASTGVAVLHDTGGLGFGSAKTPSSLQKLGHDVINLEAWGDGLALVRPPRGAMRTLARSIGSGSVFELYAEVAAEDEIGLAARARVLCSRADDDVKGCADALVACARRPPRPPADALEAKIAKLEATCAALDDELRLLYRRQWTQYGISAESGK